MHIHVHVLMLRRKFELIPIKLDFKKIFKVAQELGQSSCTILQCVWLNFFKND